MTGVRRPLLVDMRRMKAMSRVTPTRLFGSEPEALASLRSFAP